MGDSEQEKSAFEMLKGVINYKHIYKKIQAKIQEGRATHIQSHFESIAGKLNTNVELLSVTVDDIASKFSIIIRNIGPDCLKGGKRKTKRNNRKHKKRTLYKRNRRLK